jgi:hypothetical protein
MDLQDLKEAYSEYNLGRFSANDLAEYNELFLQICKEYGWDITDLWMQAKFEVEYIFNDVVPYNENWEYFSPLTGFHYRENEAVHPEVNRPGDFVLIDGDWKIL